MTAKCILVVDDEEAIRTVIRDGLCMYGYGVDTAANPDEALATFGKKPYDLALVDLKMPGSMNGLQLLAEIHRQWPQTITIVLTGYATLDSAIAAIRQGASDYIRKPVGIAELAESVQRNLLAKQISPASPKVASVQSKDNPTMRAGRFFQSPQLFIDRLKHLVMLNNQIIQLTQVEFAVLDFLVSHQDRVVGAAELLKSAQGYEIYEMDARPIVRVHIQHLRQKLGDDGKVPSLILNVRGKGYRYIG